MIDQSEYADKNSVRYGIGNRQQDDIMKKMSGNIARKMRYALYRSLNQIAGKDPGAVRLYGRDRKSGDDIENEIHVRTHGRGYLQPGNSQLA